MKKSWKYFSELQERHERKNFEQKKPHATAWGDFES
jgi:hypothetical protein